MPLLTEINLPADSWRDSQITVTRLKPLKFKVHNAFGDPLKFPDSVVPKVKKRKA